MFGLSPLSSAPLDCVHAVYSQNALKFKYERRHACPATCNCSPPVCPQMRAICDCMHLCRGETCKEPETVLPVGKEQEAGASSSSTISAGHSPGPRESTPTSSHSSDVKAATQRDASGGQPPRRCGDTGLAEREHQQVQRQHSWLAWLHLCAFCQACRRANATTILHHVYVRVGSVLCPLRSCSTIAI